jgi:Mn2+/Fe2+ NRAMP family transporter
MSGSKGLSISNTSAITGSVFLMATSAIGPGFITQTTVFTEKLRTSFGFIILCSIILDIIIQLNIWRIITISGLRAQDLSNKTVPGTGYVLAVLVCIGGLAFNTGNVAGAGLGLEVLTGMDIRLGVVASVLVALALFWYKQAGKAMDQFTKILGIVMIGLTIFIVYKSGPPVAETVRHSFFPEIIDPTAIIILVGGTVGGYISFAGAHRLLDAGISGVENKNPVTNASIRAILLASLMRILLFLAALGVVYSGGILDPGNPAASVFKIAAGNMGFKIFGVILWSAAITSVIGSAYTSISFIKSFHPFLLKNQTWLVTIFILISTIIFLLIGKPVKVLVIVGALNAFILPFALGIILFASVKRKLFPDYRHPVWLQISGWVVVLILLIMSVNTVYSDLANLWSK